MTDGLIGYFVSSCLLSPAVSSLQDVSSRLQSPSPSLSPHLHDSKIKELDEKLVEKTLEAEGLHRRRGQAVAEMRSVTNLLAALLVQDNKLPEVHVDEDRRGDPTLELFQEKLSSVASRFRLMEVRLL